MKSGWTVIEGLPEEMGSESAIKVLFQGTILNKGAELTGLKMLAISLVAVLLDRDSKTARIANG